MSVVEFKYSKYKNHYLPIIPILIKGSSLWHEVRVFVDSGATYTVLEYREIERLNIKLGNDKMYVKVGDGGYIAVNIVTLPIRIGDFEFKAKIGFSKDLGVGFNILGRKNIFEKFTVCLNDKNGIIKFITNDEQNHI